MFLLVLFSLSASVVVAATPASVERRDYGPVDRGEVRINTDTWHYRRFYRFCAYPSEDATAVLMFSLSDDGSKSSHHLVVYYDYRQIPEHNVFGGEAIYILGPRNYSRCKFEQPIAITVCDPCVTNITNFIFANITIQHGGRGYHQLESIALHPWQYQIATATPKRDLWGCATNPIWSLSRLYVC